MWSFYLHSEYARWTYDPDDPAIKALPKRKAPPIPLIRPVAHRPPSVAERYQAAYELMASQFAPEDSPLTIGKQWVTSDEFDAFLNL